MVSLGTVLCTADSAERLVWDKTIAFLLAQPVSYSHHYPLLTVTDFTTIAGEHSSELRPDTLLAGDTSSSSTPGGLHLLLLLLAVSQGLVGQTQTEE